MVCQRLAITVFTILALTSGSLLPAQETEKQPQGKGFDRLDAVARKLNLSDRQKQQVKQMYEDFDRKADPLIRQLCKHRDQEWQTLQNVLNEGQRAKLMDVLRAQGAKELQSIAQKLNLSEEQKQSVEKIRKDFWQKFLDLCTRKGENLAREYRELHADVVGAAREVLTPEQRAKLPAIQKQDFDEWHDYIYRHDHLKALGEQLGLSAAQLNQLQQACASCEKELEQPRAQLKQLCKEGCAALEQVLNAEQRARFHEVFPFHFLAVEQPAAEKRQKE
jgi:Spy/CpxP family protein refolding chaperone